jgi:hypothetical protein
MKYKKANKERLVGNCIALPEWSKKLWFADIKTRQLFTMNKKGQIKVQTKIKDIHAIRQDWKTVVPNKKQSAILGVFFNGTSPVMSYDM